MSEASQQPTPTANQMSIVLRLRGLARTRSTRARTTASATGYDAQTVRTNAGVLGSATMSLMERLQNVSTLMTTIVRASTTMSTFTRPRPSPRTRAIHRAAAIGG